MANFDYLTSPHTVNNADGVIFKVGVTQGDVSLHLASTAVSGTTRDLPNIGQNIMKVDTVQSKNKPTKDILNAIKDTVVSDPSGYNINRVPTWGDGKISRVTTWPDDHEVTTNGEFTYFKPLAIQNKDYGSLST